jgi:hypothetical protein
MRKKDITKNTVSNTSSCQNFNAKMVFPTSLNDIRKTAIKTKSKTKKNNNQYFFTSFLDGFFISNRHSLFEIFVIFHIEPHRKKEGLQSADKREDKRHGIDIRDISVLIPNIEESDYQRDARRQKEAGKQVKENERMKILDDIFKNQRSLGIP